MRNELGRAAAEEAKEDHREALEADRRPWRPVPARDAAASRR